MLDYGYAILRSAVLRSLAFQGFIAALGLHHTSRAGTHALADDLMEPLRPFIDAALRDFVLKTDAPEMKAWMGAAASVLLQGGVLKFTFGVPAGVPGTPRDTGAPGQPFAQAVVDSVTTLPAGSSATVSVSFDGTNVHFDFGLPQGLPGQDGEVLASQLAAEIMTTSSNTNAVVTLDSPFGDPDMEALRQKMNELILALRR